MKNEKIYSTEELQECPYHSALNVDQDQVLKTAAWGEDDNQEDPGTDPDPRQHGESERSERTETSTSNEDRY